jgi:membrane fusion protein, multidrug efflux system
MRFLLPALMAGVALLAACSKIEPAPEPVRAVKVLTVQAQSAGGTSEYAGEVRARTESRLGFRVGGKIVARPAELGARVKAGQVLARLDSRDLKLGQDSAQAALAAAQANFEQARADQQRYKELLDKGFISAAELQRRDTTLTAAQAQLEQARAQANVQGNQAGYAALVADAAGVITGVDAEPGMVVGAGSPVLRLAHDGPRDVVFAVPEDRVGQIKALSGKEGALQIRFWGAGSAPVKATVREIAAAADSSSRTFTVKADLGASTEVRLGQTATVMVALPRVEGVAKLPLSALTEQQGKSMVWLVDQLSMTVKLQPVKVLGADGNQAVIGDGLQAGQVVVVAGVHVLNPGQKVKFFVEPGQSPAQAPARAAAESGANVATR